MRGEIRDVLEQVLREAFTRAVTELSSERDRTLSLHRFQYHSDRRGSRGFTIEIFLRQPLTSITEGAGALCELPEADYSFDLGPGLPYWVMDYLFDLDRHRTRGSDLARRDRFETFLRTQWYTAVEDYEFRRRERYIERKLRLAEEIGDQTLVAQTRHELILERQRVEDHFAGRGNPIRGGSTGRWGGGRGNPYTAPSADYMRQLRSGQRELRGLYEQQWVIEEEAVISETATEILARQQEALERAGPLRAEARRRMDELVDAQFYAQYGTTPRYSGVDWAGGWDNQDPSAAERGLKLLRENLSPEQLAQWDQFKWFAVKGCSTEKTYRIKKGRQQNVFELNSSGTHVVKGWCFLTEGNLVEGDVMLAQKIALELQEYQALSIANQFTIYGNEFADLKGPERCRYPEYRGYLGSYLGVIITS